jgi:hypothetical protein
VDLKCPELGCSEVKPNVINVLNEGGDGSLNLEGVKMIISGSFDELSKKFADLTKEIANLTNGMADLTNGMNKMVNMLAKAEIRIVASGNAG